MFQFGVGRQRIKGTITIRIPIADHFLAVTLDVVPANLPLLIGLDVIDRYKVSVDAARNQLSSVDGSWCVPLQRKNGHLYYLWTVANVLYTRAELVKLHKHLFHPTTGKLYNLIERASPLDCTPSTRSLLEDISKCCNVCQTFGARPLSFQVSLPEEKITFNSELALDLFWLDGRATLHVVDLATGYSNSAFLIGQSVEDVWNTFVLCWATVYPGYPNSMRVDQGANSRQLVGNDVQRPQVSL